MNLCFLSIMFRSTWVFSYLTKHMQASVVRKELCGSAFIIFLVLWRWWGWKWCWWWLGYSDRTIKPQRNPNLSAKTGTQTRVWFEKIMPLPSTSIAWSTLDSLLNSLLLRSWPLQTITRPAGQENFEKRLSASRGRLEKPNFCRWFLRGIWEPKIQRRSWEN